MPVSSLRMAAPVEGSGGGAVEPQEAWLRDFHAGTRDCMERCYRDHLATVSGVVAGVLAGADGETLVHEVFFRLLTDASLRAGFQGGSLGSWLRVVSRNQAIDFARRRRLKVSFSGDGVPGATASAPSLEHQNRRSPDAQRFRERLLPPSGARSSTRVSSPNRISRPPRARSNAADDAGLSGVSNPAAAAPVRSARGADMTSFAATAPACPIAGTASSSTRIFGASPARRRAPMRLHLVDCADCRAYYDRHLRLALVDPQAALPANERLARGLGLSPRRPAGGRRGWLALAATAATCAVVLLAVGRGGERADPQPRGGAAPGSQLLVYEVAKGRPAQPWAPSCAPTAGSRSPTPTSDTSGA